MDFEGEFHEATTSLGLLRAPPWEEEDEEAHLLKVPSRKDKVQPEGIPQSSLGTLERELIAYDFWELIFFFLGQTKRVSGNYYRTLTGYGKGCQ